MNELKPEDVLEILDRMEFFQGQRAGRELWHNKPFEVQEQDIADFNKGIAAVRGFIKVALALLREKDAEIERLEELCQDYHSACANLSFERDDAKKRMDNLYNAIATYPKFRVIDTKTDEYPDLWKIASKEDWAKSLCYCDMEGFAITEDGGLILCDECGRYEYASQDRFKVIWETKQATKVRADAITEFAERLKTFYRNLNGKTVGGSVEYHIEQVAKEMRGEEQ